MAPTISGTAYRLIKWLEATPGHRIDISRVDDGFARHCHRVKLCTEHGYVEGRFADSYIAGVIFDGGAKVELLDTPEFLEWVNGVIQ